MMLPMNNQGRKMTDIVKVTLEKKISASTSKAEFLIDENGFTESSLPQGTTKENFFKDLCQKMTWRASTYIYKIHYNSETGTWNVNYIYGSQGPFSKSISLAKSGDDSRNQDRALKIQVETISNKVDFDRVEAARKRLKAFLISNTPKNLNLSAVLPPSPSLQDNELTQEVAPNDSFSPPAPTSLPVKAKEGTPVITSYSSNKRDSKNAHKRHSTSLTSKTSAEIESEISRAVTFSDLRDLHKKSNSPDLKPHNPQILIKLSPEQVKEAVDSRIKLLEDTFEKKEAILKNLYEQVAKTKGESLSIEAINAAVNVLNPRDEQWNIMLLHYRHALEAIYARPREDVSADALILRLNNELNIFVDNDSWQQKTRTYFGDPDKNISIRNLYFKMIKIEKAIENLKSQAAVVILTREKNDIALICKTAVALIKQTKTEHITILTQQLQKVTVEDAFAKEAQKALKLRDGENLSGNQVRIINKLKQEAIDLLADRQKAISIVTELSSLRQPENDNNQLEQLKLSELNKKLEQAKLILSSFETSAQILLNKIIDHSNLLASQSKAKEVQAAAEKHVNYAKLTHIQATDAEFKQEAELLLEGRTKALEALSEITALVELTSKDPQKELIDLEQKVKDAKECLAQFDASAQALLAKIDNHKKLLELHAQASEAKQTAEEKQRDIIEKLRAIQHQDTHAAIKARFGAKISALLTKRDEVFGNLDKINELTQLNHEMNYEEQLNNLNQELREAKDELNSFDSSAEALSKEIEDYRNLLDEAVKLKQKAAAQKDRVAELNKLNASVGALRTELNKQRGQEFEYKTELSKDFSSALENWEKAIKACDQIESWDQGQGLQELVMDLNSNKGYIDDFDSSIKKQEETAETVNNVFNDGIQKIKAKIELASKLVELLDLFKSDKSICSDPCIKAMIEVIEVYKEILNKKPTATNNEISAAQLVNALAIVADKWKDRINDTCTFYLFWTRPRHTERVKELIEILSPNPESEAKSQIRVILAESVIQLINKQEGKNNLGKEHGYYPPAVVATRS